MNISLLIYGVVLLLFILYVEKRFDRVWFALDLAKNLLVKYDKRIDELYAAVSDLNELGLINSEILEELADGKLTDSSETVADN